MHEALCRAMWFFQPILRDETMSLANKSRIICATIFLLAQIHSAIAWDGMVSGKIAHLDGVGGSAGAPGNYDLRVVLENQSVMCAGASDATWAYINSNDA